MPLLYHYTQTCGKKNTIKPPWYSAADPRPQPQRSRAVAPELPELSSPSGAAAVRRESWRGTGLGISSRFGFGPKLVGGLVALFYFPIYRVSVIIPIDELIFFRGVAQAQPEKVKKIHKVVLWWHNMTHRWIIINLCHVKTCQIRCQIRCNCLKFRRYPNICILESRHDSTREKRCLLSGAVNIQQGSVRDHRGFGWEVWQCLAVERISRYANSASLCACTLST